MKRILLAILFIAFSIGISEAKVSLKPTGLCRIESKRISVDRNSPEKLSRQFPRGLTYYKDYSNLWANLSADLGLGSSAFTFTRTNVNATFVDKTGVVKTVSTANVPRMQGGYYDATGFHTGNAGLMIESSVVNRATYSGTPENAIWVKTNVTADNDDAGSSSPDGVATANSLTATAANGTFVQAYAITGDPATYTASAWVKRKTGTGVVDLGAVEDGTGKTAITLPANTWVRVSVTATTDGDDAGKDPAFYMELESDTDAVYVYGMQLEAMPYMTSYIPNATSAKTRGVEDLSYLRDNNVPVITNPGTVMVKGTFNVDASTQAGFFYHKGSTDSRIYLYKNASAGTMAFNLGDSKVVTSTSTYSVNTSIVLGGVFTGAGGIGKLFVNGIQEGGDSNPYTPSGTYPTTFVLGKNTGNVVNNVVIQSVAIFNRALGASVVADTTNLMEEN